MKRLRSEMNPKQGGNMKKTRRELIVNMAKKVLGTDGLVSKVQSIKVRPMLRQALSRKPLPDTLGSEEKQNKPRALAELSDGNVIGLAKKTMQDKKLSTRRELLENDPELYGTLRMRGLLDEVGFEPKTRSWAEVNDAELMQNVAVFTSENAITSLPELRNADWGLYQVLHKRKLLGHVKLVKSD
ncbi:hypothetical protein KKE92_02740 [Candidatus Micrarchaeota archaeon]|nr:hypothetical protein [Candidatus Micrarchaeota archaeon]